MTLIESFKLNRGVCMSQSAQNIASVFSSDVCLNSQDRHLDSVMSDISRLSKSLASSYQYLEGHVEQLNDELQDVNEKKSEAIEEQQRLISEKQTVTDRLQNLLAVLPSGVVVLDGKGIVRDCNAVAISILGRPLLGESWLSVINRAFLPQADDGHQISLKDGRKVHLETRALDSEPGQLIVLTDMTKTRQLQADLSQQQKLSSMGQMVASLAHQIRTPLAAAILYGSHLNGKKLTDTKKQEFSGHLMERLKFMDRQISDMLNFVKGEKKEKQLITVNKLVNAIRVFSDSFTHSIIFEVDRQSLKERSLLADIDSLVGAIGNLVDNAIDASIDESPVTIRIYVDQLNRLFIQVKDQGKGIPENDKAKLFEPFFSTKNNGNGLGLAVVRGIVVEHYGLIAVDSSTEVDEVVNVTQGSRFNIYLPVYQTENNCLSNVKGEPLVKESLEEKDYDY